MQRLLRKKSETTGGKGDLGTRKRQGKLESKTEMGTKWERNIELEKWKGNCC